MALRRSRVRVPLGPLFTLFLYRKCTIRLGLQYCRGIQMSKKIISNLETIEQLIESEGIPPLDNRYDVWFDLRNSDVGGLGGSTG